MPSTAIERRSVLAGMAAAALSLRPAGAARARPADRRSAGPRTCFAACRASGADACALSLFDSDGALLLDLPSPGRGHALARRPDHEEIVVFARRPGRFALAVGLADGRVRRLESADDRHFYGHGAFSADGRLLYTENDYADGCRQVAEMPSGTIGPHQIALAPDGGSLVICNGGIRTHPDFGRTELNLDDMAPSLDVLDLADGRPRTLWRPSARLHRLGVRAGTTTC